MKTALITGAAKGLGRDIAIFLAKEGYAVGINYKTSIAEAKETLQQLQQYNNKSFSSQGDVTNEAYAAKLVAEAVERLGGIGVLVNIVGDFLPLKPYPESTKEEMNYMINSNYYSAYLMSREVLPVMKTQGYGKIINFGALGVERDIVPPHSTPYHIAKKMVSMMTKRMAKDAPDGVTINQINPSALESAAFAPEGVDLVAHSEVIDAVKKIINGSSNGEFCNVGTWEPEE